MPLKAKITKEEYEKLPDALKEHYAEQDGSFVLQAEGFPDTKKYEEFRENNRKMNKELADLREKAKAAEEEKNRAEAEKEKLKNPPGHGKELEEAIEKATKPLKDKMHAIEEERNTLRMKQEEQEFTNSVASVAKKMGVQDDYLVDVLGRAKNQGFKLTEEGVKAMKGDEIARGDDGKEVTVESFVKGLPAAFFGKTAGSGAPPQGKGGSGTRILHDPTPMELGRHAEAIAKGTMEVRRSTSKE